MHFSTSLLSVINPTNKTTLLKARKKQGKIDWSSFKNDSTEHMAKLKMSDDFALVFWVKFQVDVPLE